MLVFSLRDLGLKEALLSSSMLPPSGNVQKPRQAPDSLNPVGSCNNSTGQGHKTLAQAFPDRTTFHPSVKVPRAEGGDASWKGNGSEG